MFRGVSALLGMAWGLLGVKIEAVLVRGGTVPPLRNNPALVGVIVGMVLGVMHANKLWLVRGRQPTQVWPLEVLLWAFVCMALGCLWGSLVVIVLPLFSLGEGGPVILYVLTPLFGVLLGMYSALPAAILMAPVTVVVWRKLLERLLRR
jgi:hypothetical protein